MIPNTFDGESTDTLGHARKCVLGNHAAETIQGDVDTWVRREVDQNGLEFGDPAAAAAYYPFHDSENFTLRVMDGSGWCNEAANEEIVCKGAAIPDATTVILSGTVLSYPEGEARQEMTAAAVEVIIDAIKDPTIGGYNDRDGDVIPDDVDNCPFVENEDQFDNYPPNGNNCGDACDCEGNFDCDGDCDGTDALTFKVDFGRSIFDDPCESGDTCNGDIDCDGDCDGTDAAELKADFGRTEFNNPCPACVVGEWCVYSE